MEKTAIFLQKITFARLEHLSIRLKFGEFLQTVPDASGNQIPNPNQFFVFGFTDAALGGSVLVPQQLSPFAQLF